MAKAKRFTHQQGGLAFLMDKDAAAIFWDLGTGKTRVFLEDLLVPGRLPAIIITKAPIVEHIENECRTWLPATPVVAITSDTPAVARRRFLLTPPMGVVIISYDLLKLTELTKSPSRFRTAIADESTMVKNHRTARFSAVRALFRPAHYRRIVSGLPAPEGPLDLWAQFDLLRPGTLTGAWWTARNRYMRPTDPNGWKWIPRDDALAQIESAIAPMVMRCSKSECMDLPPKVFQTRWVKPSRATLDLQQQIVDTWETPYKTINEAADRANKLLQITCGFHYGEGRVPHYHDDTEKTKAIVDILTTEVLPDDRAVIWTPWIAHASTLAHELGHLLRKTDRIVLTSEPDELRVWRGTPGAVLVTTFRLDTGVSLAESSVSIFAARPLKTDSRVQAEDRSHRPPQCNTVRIIDVISNTYYDRQWIKCLQRKISIAEAIKMGAIQIPGGQAA